MATFTDRILDECSRRGTCLLNRAQFDEAFLGHDVTSQVRAAIDFAQQHDLAFARSTGDQSFIFSRLPKANEPSRGNPPPSAQRPKPRRGNRRPGFKPKSKGVARRPIGRSF